MLNSSFLSESKSWQQLIQQKNLKNDGVNSPVSRDDFWEQGLL